jgi:hypothetical protein
MIVLLLAFSAFILAVSGVVEYLDPKGHGAYMAGAIVAVALVFWGYVAYLLKLT